MGLFSRKSNSEQRAAEAPREENAQVAPQAEALPQEGPLRNLVNVLLADGAERGRMTLTQRGSEMKVQTERSVGGSPQNDSGTVDQQHPLFNDVAALYTESMSQDSGAWRTVVITAGPSESGARTAQVDYDYPAAEHRTEIYAIDGAPQADGAASAAGTGQGEEPSPEAGRNAGVQAGEQPADTHQATGQNVSAQETAGDEAGSGRGVAAGAGAAAGAGVGAGALSAAAAEGRQEASAEDTGAEPAHGLGNDDAGRTRSSQGASSTTQATEGAPAGAPADAPAAATGQGDVPEHVDHDEWRDDDAGRSGAQATGAAAAGAAAGAGARSAAGAGGGDAPSMAQGADVAPSYRAGEAGGHTPSRDKLAEGNKVLSEADVLRRLANANKRLFGPEGTARDVSTVLIRVRTLGTYYDALTHVRQGGFWDQRPSFDVIPEEELQVQQLKEDSYVEGEGAPLAIMFRFRPGIPPEVSFDYADEEAFVRYPERLPSQNYVEELRMYPRTGANIPQHVNDALQDWNY